MTVTRTVKRPECSLRKCITTWAEYEYSCRNFPQGRTSSTDPTSWMRAGERRAWLGAMNLQRRIARWAKGIHRAADRGMSTAEYAVGTVAAVAFAVVLYKIVRSDAVSSALSNIVQSALHAI
jgi:hypothetical protein